MQLHIIFFLIFMVLNLFADLNFTNLTIVTSNTSADLPPNEIHDSNPKIAADASGKYVYAIWETDGIQLVKSSDFGITWTNPLTVTGKTPPYLSQVKKHAQYPRIATDSKGKHVYAIWQIKHENCLIIQTAKSSDYGHTWTFGASAAANAAETLSQGEGDAYFPQIAADASGQHVYAIWIKHNEAGSIIQTAASSDFGSAWTYPLAVTGDGGTPNLSMSGQNADSPQIATDSSGRHVYAIWKRFSDNVSVIQAVKSSDFGSTWNNPIAVTGSEPPNLSQEKKMANQPKIATDAGGRHVYAIWKRHNGINTVIQTARSFDFGNTWTGPIATTGSSFPDLSQNGRDADMPQIATDAGGKYVYAIWIRSNGSNWIAQSAKSSDYGLTWTNPTAAFSGKSPNLSQDGQDAMDPQITTDSGGRHVYAIWKKYDGNNTLIQSVASADYGTTWINLTNAAGSPLFQEGIHSCKPRITTDAGGKYVYVLWEGRNKNMIIQSINNLSFTPALRLYGSQIKISSPFQTELSNKLNWDSIARASKYRIYSDESRKNLIAEIHAPNLEFTDHRIKSGSSKTYYVTWIDKEGNESSSEQLTLP